MVTPAASSKARNPYGQLTAIRTLEMFFGREGSLELLYEAFLDGQSLAIIGSRRIGKSSLLACSCLVEVQQRLDYDLSDQLLVLVDLEEHLQKTPDAFFAYVGEQLLRQGQQKLTLEMLPGPGSDQFVQLLNQLQAAGVHPVLLLDEFDSIVRNPQFNPDFFSFLRAQANSGRVSFVTASLSTLDQICHPEIVGSPFFNIFSHHNLGPLTEPAARELISQPSEAAGYPMTQAEIELVLSIAGLHPFYVHRTCYYLFQHKSRVAGMLDPQRLKSQVYEELLPHFTYAWNHLSSEQQDHLRREAIRQEALHRRRVPELSGSALFRRFVRSKARLAADELTMENLRDILDDIDDFKVLGTSHLSNLNIIFNEEHNEMLTTIERGMRVRDLLLNALTQLQPPGSTSAIAPEWQMYNVLNSCYFKRDRRSNKQLASYLGMSERDFYRKRDEAVTALLNIIFKMDAQCVEALEG